MGFFSKIGKIADISSKIGTIANKLDLGKVAGIDLQNLSVDSLGSVKDQIAGTLLSQMTGLTTDINSIVNIGDLESQVTSLTGDLQNSINLDNLVNISESTDFSDIDVNSLLNFDPVSFM